MEVPLYFYFNVCQPVLLVGMHSKGKESPTPPPSPSSFKEAHTGIVFATQ